MGWLDEWTSKFQDGAKAPEPLTPVGQKVKDDFVEGRVKTAVASDLSSAFGGGLQGTAEKARKEAAAVGVGRPLYPGAPTLRAGPSKPYREAEDGPELTAESAAEKYKPAFTQLSEPSRRDGELYEITGPDDDSAGESDRSAAQLQDDWRRERIKKPNTFGTLGEPTMGERLAVDVAGFPVMAPLGFVDELTSRITGNPKWLPEKGFDSVAAGLGEVAANPDKIIASVFQNIGDRDTEAAQAARAVREGPLDPDLDTAIAEVAKRNGTDPELLRSIFRDEGAEEAGSAAFLRTSPERLGFREGSDKSWGESLYTAGGNILPEIGRMVLGVAQLAGEGVELGQRDRPVDARIDRATNVLTQIPAELAAMAPRTALTPLRTVEEEPVSTLLNAIWVSPAWKGAAKPVTDTIRQRGGGSPAQAEAAAARAFNDTVPLVEAKNQAVGGLKDAADKAEIAATLDREAVAALEAPAGQAHVKAAAKRKALDRQLAELDDTIQRAKLSREPIQVILDEAPKQTNTELAAASDSVTGQRVAIAERVEAARKAESQAQATVATIREQLAAHEKTRPILPDEWATLRQEYWAARKSKAKRADRASRNQAVKDRFKEMAAWQAERTRLRKEATRAGKEAVKAKSASAAEKASAAKELERLIGLEDVAKGRSGAVQAAVRAQGNVAPTRPVSQPNARPPLLSDLYEQRGQLLEQWRAAKAAEVEAQGTVRTASAQSFPVYEIRAKRQIESAAADTLAVEAARRRAAAERADEVWSAQKAGLRQEAKAARERLAALEAARPSVSKSPVPGAARQAEIADEVAAAMRPQLDEMLAANRAAFNRKPDADVHADWTRLVAQEAGRRARSDYRAEAAGAAELVGNLEAQVARLRADAAGKAPDPYASVIQISDNSAAQSQALDALPGMEAALDQARGQLMEAQSKIFDQAYQHFPDDLKARLVMDRSAVEVAETSAKALIAERGSFQSLRDPAYDGVDKAVRAAEETLRSAKAQYKATLADAKAYRAQYDAQVAGARGQAQSLERRLKLERELFDRDNARTLRAADDAERRAMAARKAADAIEIPAARTAARLDELKLREADWQAGAGDFKGRGMLHLEAAIAHARKTQAAVKKTRRYEAAARQIEKLPVVAATLGTSLAVDAIGAALARALSAPGKGAKRWLFYAQKNRIPPELLTEMRRQAGHGSALADRLEDAFASMPKFVDVKGPDGAVRRIDTRASGRMWAHMEHTIAEGGKWEPGNVRPGAPGSVSWSMWDDVQKQWDLTDYGRAQLDKYRTALDENTARLDDLKARLPREPDLLPVVREIEGRVRKDAEVLYRFNAEMQVNNRYMAPLVAESRGLTMEAEALGLLGEPGSTRPVYWPAVYPKKRGFKTLAEKEIADRIREKAQEFVDGAAPTPRVADSGAKAPGKRTTIQEMSTPDRSNLAQNLMRAQRIPMTRRELVFGQSTKLADEVQQLGALNASVQIRKVQSFAAQKFARTEQQVALEARTRALIDDTGELESASARSRYVKVSEDMLPNGTPKYGDLAGKYLPEDIYYELANAQALIEQAQGFLPTLIRAMKMGKTVLSPATHARNFLTNVFILAPMAGMSLLNPKNWPYYLEAIRNRLSNTKSPAFQELQRAGQGAGGVVKSELSPNLVDSPSILGRDVATFVEGFKAALEQGGTAPVQYFMQLAFRPAESLLESAKGIKDAVKEIGALRRNAASDARIETNAEWMARLGEREKTPQMDAMGVTSVADLGREVASGTRGALKSPVDAAARLYNFSDQVFRDALGLKRLAEGKTAAMAVDAATTAYVDYGGVPGWVNVVRSPYQFIGSAGTPVMGTMGAYMLASAPFMAFTAAAVPLFAKWLQRSPVEALTWLTISDYVTDLNLADAGIDPQDAKKALSRLPARQQNKFTLMASVAPTMALDDIGRLRMMDTSFGNPVGSVFPSWDPYTNDVTNTLNALREVGGVGELPFGIAPLFGVVSGYDSGRNSIFTDGMSANAEDIATRLSHLAQTALPAWTPSLTDWMDWEMGADGGVSNLERIKGGYEWESKAKAKEGALDEYGNVVTDDQNELKLMGVRTTALDTVELARHHMNRLRRSWIAANETASSQMRDPRRYSDYADEMDGDIDLAEEHARRTVWRLRPMLIELNATLDDVGVPDDLEEAKYQLEEIVSAIEPLSAPDELPNDEWNYLRGLVNQIQGAAFQSAGASRKRARLGRPPETVAP